MDLPEYVTPAGGDGWRIALWVQPGAKKDEVQGLYQGRLKVRIKAPAVDNKANKALRRYFASLTGVRESAIRLEQGASSRRKVLLIEGGLEPDWTVLLEATSNP